MGLIASIASIIFAALAAFFWAWSSLVKLPIIGSGYGTIDNLEPFYAAIKWVARLNSLAAGCAFISAVCQALALHSTF